MILRLLAVALVAGLLSFAAAPTIAQEAPRAGQYQNFRVAIYVVVGSTRRLADRAVFDREFERVMRQVPFDKVYLESYRNHQFATDEELTAVAGYFRERGILVEGGITPAAGGQGGQFGTFDYENPTDMAECRRAAEQAARHFDHFILDDFFFYNSKTDLDIAARGERSWTQYRLETMRRASRECVLDPARAVNPDVQVTIKYPNWYEHFHGTGFDLAEQPAMFAAIYTGTETRDPHITDQLLQQYESYSIFRYFSNIAPGRNLGGWVDTFDTQYVDRYAEQLWLTMFAKAPEITLFNWAGMAGETPLAPGTRPWRNRPTSFRWADMTRAYRSVGEGDPGPGWGAAAGYSLRQIDAAVAHLGHPVGIAAYRPPYGVGEDFLHNYLGNIGIPIEMSASFPTEARTVLLTEGASVDPEIVTRIHEALSAGHNVVITSGFLAAMQDRGIDSIVELDVTGRVAAIDRFIDGYGAGAGTSLNSASGDDPAVLFPEIRFYTNDSWPIVRGVANARGFPIMLMNRYSRGIVFVLNIPDNPSDLYNLPQPLLTRLRHYVQGDFPIRLDAPALVSLFAYDNDTFIVHSFRDAPTDVSVAVSGEGLRLTNALTGAEIAALPPPPAVQNWRSIPEAPRMTFPLRLEPHSYQVLRITR